MLVVDDAQRARDVVVHDLHGSRQRRATALRGHRMARSLPEDVVATLVDARRLLVEEPPPRGVTWRGIHTIRRAARVINSEAFARATMIAVRAIKARGHASSEAFAEAATDADELAVMDEAIAMAREANR
jgi:hypothetical protein